MEGGVMKRPTQLQVCYMADRKFAEMNLAFLDLVKDGLTRKELQTLIDRRPHVYGRFNGWLDKLGE
jgi:hypothetical protein